MGSKERKARDKARVRKQILDAARDHFTRYGYEGVTMRRIAQEVEYTPTTLYLHFQNKQALLQELSDQAALALGVEFGKLCKERDLLERVRSMGKAYIQFALTHPNEYQLLFMTPQLALPPDQSAIRKGDPEQDAYALLVETMTEAMAAGLLRPTFSDPEQAAQVLWSAMHGFVSLTLVRHNDRWINWRPVAPTGGLVIDTLVAGLTGHAASTISSPEGTQARSR